MRINPMPCDAKRLILVASYQPTNQAGSKAARLRSAPQPVLHRAAGNCLGPGADLEPCLYALQSLRKTHSDGESFCISWLRQEWLLSEKWRNGKTLKVISSPGSAILKLFWGLLVSHLVWFGNLFPNIQLGYLDQFVPTIGASKRTRGLNLPRSKEG